MSDFNHAINLTHDGTLILRIPKGYQVDKVVVEEMGTENRKEYQPTRPTPSNTLGALDCVERQKAIDALDKRFDSIPMEQTTEIMFLRKDLRELPSVQPERKKGEWIETEFLKLRECSCCHVRWGMYDVENFDFCPSCGCRMREGDAE